MTSDGALVLVFDDGYTTDDETVRPVLDAAGVPACLAIVPEWLGTDSHLSADRLQELDDHGWEVAAHGSRHRYLQAHRLARDAASGDDRLILDSDHVFPEGDHGVYPGDQFEITDGTHDEVQELAGKGTTDRPFVDLESPLEESFAAADTVLRPTVGTLRDEIVAVQDAFDDIGFDPSTFVLPYDAVDARAWSLIEDHYDALPNAAVRSIPNPAGTPLTSLRRYYLETDALTEVEIETYLDYVSREGGIGVLAGHSAWETVPADRIEFVVDAAHARGIDITTFERIRAQ